MSNDKLVAGAINTFQYLALGFMICSHLRFKTGNEWQVGTFTHSTMNVHIYDRHWNALIETLDNSNDLMCNNEINEGHMFALPVDKNFYDITFEDFVINIKTGKKLKSELELAI